MVSRLVISTKITKSKWIMLTGAGASRPLGKDTTAEFVARCESEPRRTQVFVTFNDLVADLRKRGEVLDIELLLDAVKQLSSSAQSLLAFGSPVSPIRASLRDLSVRWSAMEEAILGIMVEHYGAVDDLRAHELYKPILEDLAFKTNSGVIPLFTTNYDTAVESAADGSQKIMLLDGLNRLQAAGAIWDAENFARPPSTPKNRRLVALFKMHGSTTWGRHKITGVIRQLAPGHARNPDPYEHVLVYPSTVKEQLRDEPFRTAYDAFKACLAETSVCLVIGHSLRDAEINELLKDGLRQSTRLHLVVVNPEASAQSLTSSLATTQRRFTVIPLHFGETLRRLRYSPLSRRFLRVTIDGMPTWHPTVGGSSNLAGVHEIDSESSCLEGLLRPFQIRLRLIEPCFYDLDGLSSEA